MYTNADTLTTKMAELEHEISESNPDVVMITEVKPKRCLHSVTTSCLVIKGYCDPYNNLNNDGRGICIYIKNGLNLEINEKLI